jgi:hypothetical protein
MPILGWARVDLARELAGRHLAVDYEQAADLALSAADP